MVISEEVLMSVREEYRRISEVHAVAFAESFMRDRMDLDLTSMFSFVRSKGAIGAIDELLRESDRSD